MRRWRLRLAAGFAALAALALALAMLARAENGVLRDEIFVGETPVTVSRPSAPAAVPAPAVVVAHGFSGSRQLMRAISTALAQAGYVVVSFDFLGHGRHPRPMAGDVTAVDGATAGILAQLGQVTAAARGLDGVDGRIALLGHSMAGDVIARLAVEQGRGVTATIAVSAFSPVVAADRPGNLLMIAGAWEGALADWALERTRAHAGSEAVFGVTYGAHAEHGARRAALAPGVEHIGVLYSPATVREAVAWLDAAFDRERASPPVSPRGPWILLMLGALVALAWPLAALLPPGPARAGAGLGGWRFWAVAAGPAIATPLLATAMDVRFLPVVVGDYLALHFALYGALTALGLWLAGAARPPRAAFARAALPALLVAAFALGALGPALDAHVSSFWPVEARLPIIAALLVGMSPWFLADEWLTRAPAAPRLAYAATKLLFLGSLAGAVALDLERLFFLIILTPALLIFFLVYGLFSGWAWRRTGEPWAGGLANAAVFAWAIGVTFPMVAG
ncbi:alpha/beta fold hydrolase [Rubrimonas cliftonensis]|uniref:Serine aminopeptidase, S33 n=1 Tax=Rubrimonas cliftonensis TaxID=89524 RepID=A0A1H4B9J6_9RHOB|nr:alpha/beta fold hydrolase [Rubrimonas cliftonensis]SEA44746.1 Serine aminopeptidase, S33 [Rubrimonas cliftonensis]